MPSMENHLKNQLDLALSPEHCEVSNESSRHSGPATESHFKIVVVSKAFDEMKLIDRHRFINKLFAEELKIMLWQCIPTALKSGKNVRLHLIHPNAQVRNRSEICSFINLFDSFWLSIGH